MGWRHALDLLSSTAFSWSILSSTDKRRVLGKCLVDVHIGTLGLGVTRDHPDSVSYCTGHVKGKLSSGPGLVEALANSHNVWLALSILWLSSLVQGIYDAHTIYSWTRFPSWTGCFQSSWSNLRDESDGCYQGMEIVCVPTSTATNSRASSTA